MIIVSQDKEIIINFEKVNIININQLNKKQIGAWFNCNEEENDNVLLGEYATEERAKEVLQEIINLNAKFELYKTMPTGGNGQAIMLDNFSNNNIKFDTYEMPEK